jgi:hypothetical protein
MSRIAAGRAGVAMLAIMAAAILVLAIACDASAARPAVASRECQHPLTTGQEATNIRGVSPKTACKVVRELARFIDNGQAGDRLYKCVGLTKTHPGRPVLVIHRFEGWKLRVISTYGLQIYRPGASFGVTGTDFPLNCT